MLQDLPTQKKKQNIVHTSSRFLPDLVNPYPPTPEFLNKEDEEFNECDVVWSSSSSSSSPASPEKTTATATTSTAGIPAISHTSTAGIPATSHTTTAGIPAISHTLTAGLSAALLYTEESRSPTSIQRKTTTSPVLMISSSMTRRDGPGGYYYGRKYHQSAPVKVPIWPNGLGSDRSRLGIELGRFDEVEDFDEFQDEGKIVPPHEIVARSHNASSFSVMEGAGRTLKGRDLTTVRNAVFQKTGFLT